MKARNPSFPVTIGDFPIAWGGLNFCENARGIHSGVVSGQVHVATIQPGNLLRNRPEEAQDRTLLVRNSIVRQHALRTSGDDLQIERACIFLTLGERLNQEEQAVHSTDLRSLQLLRARDITGG